MLQQTTTLPEVLEQLRQYFWELREFELCENNCYKHPWQWCIFFQLCCCSFSRLAWFAWICGELQYIEARVINKRMNTMNVIITRNFTPVALHHFNTQQHYIPQVSWELQQLLQLNVRHGLPLNAGQSCRLLSPTAGPLITYSITLQCVYFSLTSLGLVLHRLMASVPLTWPPTTCKTEVIRR